MPFLSILHLSWSKKKKKNREQQMTLNQQMPLSKLPEEYQSINCWLIVKAGVCYMAGLSRREKWLIMKAGKVLWLGCKAERNV